MANEKTGLLAIKVGMTQIFNDDNKVVPVTVLDLSGNTVVRVKTQDSADGYNAVQIGLGEQKEERLSKPQTGHFKKAGVSAKRYLREVRVSNADLSKYEAGSELAAADFFSAGQKIDVTGTSKGRGFAGVMKRYNFAGFITSHGTHEFFRHGGSIGTRLTPGHVLKGKKMPGHMGAERVTIQSLTVVEVDTERNLLYVKGGVPGANGGLLLVRDAVK
ncbi:MAG: 50S ribosomal protein L3 [Deltaproteobacteria bacterium]|nr:50S ribosomal protein L3 [Deltaproteobacteria bacterium]